jgi:murein DD-endopeptidase MepM/ murein hydrolase activator NlpD
MTRRGRPTTLCLIVLLTTLAGCAGLRGRDEGSGGGLYRLPYADGARVRVSRDHRTHEPPNRLDLVGADAASKRIVAAASGVVRYIVDEFAERQDTRTARQCNNNYIWLEHASGEWTKYSHVRQHSVHRLAKLRPGDRVEAGAYLGNEGDVGCASGRHLHFEVAVPHDPADPIVRAGGFIKGRNLVPHFCGVPGEVLVAGTVYVAGPCTTIAALR